MTPDTTRYTRRSYRRVTARPTAGSQLWPMTRSGHCDEGSGLPGWSLAGRFAAPTAPRCDRQHHQRRATAAVAASSRWAPPTSVPIPTASCSPPTARRIRRPPRADRCLACLKRARLSSGVAGPPGPVGIGEKARQSAGDLCDRHHGTGGPWRRECRPCGACPPSSLSVTFRRASVASGGALPFLITRIRIPSLAPSWADSGQRRTRWSWLGARSGRQCPAGQISAPTSVGAAAGYVTRGPRYWT